MYQYATHLTASTTSGNARIYFDRSKTNVRVGQGIALVDTVRDQYLEGVIDALETDGATLTANITTNVDSSWVVIPALKCVIEDDSGFKISSITGELTVTGDSVEEFALSRPGTSVTLTTYDSMPVVTSKHLVGSDEAFSFGRDIIDNQTGVRDVDYQETRAKIAGSRKFLITTDAGMDFWRDFFEEIRGAQAPFLLSTQMKDLTFFGVYSSPTTSLQVSELEYPDSFFPYTSFQYLEIEYASGNTIYRKVTAASQDGVKSTLTLSDTITAAPVRISFLQKVRASDRVALRHFGRYAEISFSIVTEDQ
jgi:hypothetical protein